MLLSIDFLIIHVYSLRTVAIIIANNVTALAARGTLHNIGPT